MTRRFLSIYNCETSRVLQDHFRSTEQWPELTESELIKNILSVQICLGEEEMEIIIIRIKGLEKVSI